MATNPNDFNASLEAKNKEHKSLIKPTIRLFKFWNSASGYPFDSFTREKWICDLSFWWAKNQRDYFLDVIDNLDASWSYSQRVNHEVERAKRIVASVRQYEKNEMQTSAETEIRKLFRL